MASEITFFSYSRTDSDFVLKLAKDLREAGINLWLDQLDIKPGSHWDSAIETALNSSHNVIVILSPAAVGSTNVMDEVSLALETGKTVIPVLLTQCNTPFRLRRLQHIDITSNYDTGLNSLLAFLRDSPAKKMNVDIFKQEDDLVESTDSEASASSNHPDENEADNSLWEETANINSISSYNQYIAEFSKGLHLEEARKRIDGLEAEIKNIQIENQLWKKTVTENSLEAFRIYLDEYPNGNYKHEAFAAIANIEEKLKKENDDMLAEKEKKLKAEREEQEKAMTYDPENENGSEEARKNKVKRNYILVAAGVVIIVFAVWGIFRMNNGEATQTPNNNEVATVPVLNDSLPNQDSINAKAMEDSINAIKKVKAQQDSINAIAKAQQDSINQAKEDSIKIVASLAPGRKYGGGIIVKLRGLKEPGLIAAEKDINGVYNWEDAKNKCAELNSNNFNGHNDWRLPDKNELALLYKNRDIIGNFTGVDYWSSTPTSRSRANHCEFSNGGFMGDNTRTARYSVRAVRNYGNQTLTKRQFINKTLLKSKTE
jgi:hypothetical protein